MMCAGLSCDAPANLFVAAGTGFSLDDQDSRARLVAFVKAHDVALVILDPLRSLSDCVDQGPRELRPLTIALRALMRETGCTIFAVHHDTKPLVGVVDGRRRPQRASGGAVFSIADSPIGIDPLADGRRLLRPTAWKFCEDPQAILLAIESGDGWLRLAGTDTDGATTGADAEAGGRILAFLAANPRASGTAIQKGVKVRKAVVFDTLQRLADSGKIDSARVGRSVRWFTCDKTGPEPFGNHRNKGASDANSVVPDARTMPLVAADKMGVPMVPADGNHSEPHQESVPNLGVNPLNGSRSYKGTVPGTTALANPEPRGLVETQCSPDDDDRDQWNL
jgi:hypothetical protein